MTHEPKHKSLERTTEKARKIQLLALDVDGVLTNGTLYFGAEGEQLKGFSILDGLGIKLLQRNHIQVAIITGRSSRIVSLRAEELGITHVFQGREDKLIALQELVNTLDISLENTAYMGDDLPDLSAIQASVLGIAPQNAHDEVKKHADLICLKSGGSGAVREAAEFILKSQNLYNAAIEKYINVSPSSS